jgi:hypothetical protein
MSLHVFGATFGLNTYELIYQLAAKQDAWIRCHSGDPAEANAALLSLKERPDLVLDLSTVATLRLLGLEWIFSAKVHRFSMTQGTWEELRKTLVDPAVSSGRKATLNYQAGGYSMTEESASAAEARQIEDAAFLAGLRENIEVLPAEALASQSHEMRSTLTDYLGEYGAESAAAAAGTGHILWTDDSQSAAVAQSLLGGRRVWTQIFLLSLVEAGILTRDDYSSAVAKLIGMMYTGVVFDALCVLKAAKMAEFRPGYFPLAQMVETFSSRAAPAENLIKIFLQFFVLMQQEPLLFHKKSVM